MDATLLLPPHVVSFLLSYLSRLDGPLPSHLISTPLRQRHHFLGLGHAFDTSQDAATYLSWPSSEQDSLRLVDLLQSLPSPENFDPLVAYTTKYSHDGETFYAHARVPLPGSYSGSDNDDSAGLRLVFRWEAEDRDGAELGHEGATATNWKYHDAKPMPFPPGSHDTPEGALHPLAEDSTPTQSHPPPAQIPTSLGPHFLSQPAQSTDEDDDSYWNSYGRSSSDDEDEDGFNYSRGAASAANDDDEKAEDAYWAQYSSVHGTADSTRHSPLPQKRKLHNPSRPVAVRPALDYSYLDQYGGHQDFLAPDADAHHEVSDAYDVGHIDYLQHLTTFRGRELSPEGIPCPEALSRRLHNLSPRASPSPSPAPPEGDLDVLSLDLEAAESPDAASPDSSDTQTLTPPGDTLTSAIPQIALPAPLAKTGEVPKEVEDIDPAVQEAIRGVYRLWSVTRKDQSEDLDASVEKEEFLEIVRDALKLI